MKKITTLGQFKIGSKYYIKGYAPKSAKSNVFECIGIRIMMYYVVIKEKSSNEGLWFYNYHFHDFDVYEIDENKNPEHFL